MTRCTRCGGLAVAEYFCGGETMFEGWSYDGIRCVNCGAVGGRPPSRRGRSIGGSLRSLSRLSSRRPAQAEHGERPGA